MTRLGRLLPDSLSGRFALLLTVALVAANLVALALLSVERGRIDREAREAREVERILSLVPAVDGAEPGRRREIARQASGRLSRVFVAAEPVVREAASGARSRLLTGELAAALPGREVRAAILARRRGEAAEGRQGTETFAVSVRLDGPTAEWLNVVSRGDRGPSPGGSEEVLVIVLGLSLAAVLGVGLVFVRRLTRPLADLARAAQAAGRGDRGARVAETGAREMRAAATAFNHMQAQIARFDAERLRTLAAVGHDLRTPITSLRIRAELLDEAEAAPMIRTLDEMTVMTDGLIAYARGAGDGETAAPLDLAALVAELCEERGAVARIDGPVRVVARPVTLKRALGNLVDNALRYGGSALVSLRRDGGEAVIGVEDEGPGIPPERLETVFAPFVRGEDSRSLETGGAGLGLSIARSIIHAHGGSIALANRDGGGLRAMVRLPLAREGRAWAG